MEKFVIDLDSILDELEENDDVSDRGHPPSLVKIANCNTFGFNNFPSIHSYCEDTQSRPTNQTSSDSIGGSTSSATSASYRRQLYSSYIESPTIEKLDSSEAEFGISIKPIETQTNQNKDLNNGNKTTYDINKEVNDSEKSRLIASLLEKAKWNTEDTTQDTHDYDIDTTSSDEEVSDEILYVAIDQNTDQKNVSEDGQQVLKEQQIEIKLIAGNNEESFGSAVDSTLKETLNVDSDLNISENTESEFNCLLEDISPTNQETIETENINNLNEETTEEVVSITDFETNLKTEPDLTEEVVTEDKCYAKWETDSIKNNFDDSSNVVKFSEIEVNIDDLTEQDINQYLSEFDDKQTEDNSCLAEKNQINVTKINSNINIETHSQTYCSDLTNEDLLNTTSDKELNSMSQSTSSVSIEDNDKISDISDYDVNQQRDVSMQSDITLDTSLDNRCNGINSVSQMIDIPTRIVRPNTLPIATNAINVNTIQTNGNINVDIDETNDENNNDSNNNETDNNLSNDVSNEVSNGVPNLVSNGVSNVASNGVSNDLSNNFSNDVFDNVSNEEFSSNGINSDFIDHSLSLGLSEDEQMLGKVKPFWIPDNETQMCMHCDIKFTLIKRRHHCRACGKVLCAQCCNSRAKLIYLDNEVARVCQICYSTLARIAAIERNANESNSSPLRPDSLYPDSSSDPSIASNYHCPDPNNPSEYCSTISPLEQEQDILNRPPPTVMVPVGVLKRGDRPKGEPKQVVFSDGIRPGGDLTETSASTSSLAFLRRAGRTQLKLKSPPVENMTALQPTTSSIKSKVSRVVITDSNGTLPPIINYYDLNYNKSVKNKPSVLNLIEFMKNKDLCPVVFALTKNLHIFAKIVLKDCCVQSECWTFASKGMATIAQDEILVTLERLPEEDTFPRDVFRLFTNVYDCASKGKAFNDLSHVYFPDGLFGNKDNSGFLFARPTLQCFSNLVLPAPPFLLAILIHKWEIPWAKVFPLRLLLRLGAEYKYYPSPIVSYRSRKPVYYEIGHTIMNVLADFRNFQYKLPIVSGLTIHLEEKQTSVHLPRNRYEQVQKVLTNSNEHVLAFGANFSLKADSHLVCMQNDADGQYQTQSINIEGATRKTTGASFIVFSGALKSSTGLTAKMSIVEDGLLVQIPPNTMTELRNALKDMKDFVVNCGKVDSEPDELIKMLWTAEDTNVNLGVRSSIDGTNLEAIQSIRIYNGTDYTNDKFVIRWTEVFFLRINEMSRRNDSLDASKLAEMISQAFCLALTSCLDQLFDNGITKIGLRINLDSDKVGYEVGSNGQSLPPQYAGQLDSALIPVIMDNISSGVEDQLIMELIFHILFK